MKWLCTRWGFLCGCRVFHYPAIERGQFSKVVKSTELPWHSFHVHNDVCECKPLIFFYCFLFATQLVWNLFNVVYKEGVVKWAADIRSVQLLSFSLKSERVSVVHSDAFILTCVSINDQLTSWKCALGQWWVNTQRFHNE